jgi:hypothetical protein
VGPRTPKPGKKKAERYLLVFCTELYTLHALVPGFLAGDQGTADLSPELRLADVAGQQLGMHGFSGLKSFPVLTDLHV